MICSKLSGYVEFFRKSQKHIALREPNIDWAATPPHKSISFCTTCMNRLSNLQDTLLQNLEDNKSYPQLEFVLLDYGSKDGLPQWAEAHLRPHIDSGRLNYYRTENPTHYNPSHSRNVSFRLAQGDIVVNVDADNYVGGGFARAINLCMSQQPDHIMAVSEDFLLPDSDRMLLQGRFAFYRQDLYALGGFDEHLDECRGYSNEDADLVFRAIMSGYKIAQFSSRHINRIHTPIKERTTHMRKSGKSYEQTKAINEELIAIKLGRGQTVVNRQGWGRDMVVKNFKETVWVS